MKKLYVIICLLLLAYSLPAQFTYHQYFDGLDTTFWSSVMISNDTSAQNIWQIGPPQKTIFNSAATQPNAMVTDTAQFYPNNNESRFVAKFLTNQFLVGVVAMQWKQKLDLEAGKDGGMVEYSIDYGNTWSNVFNDPYVYNFYGFDATNSDTLESGEYTFSGTDSTWRDIWLCFDASWLQVNNCDTMFVRFSLLTDSVDNHNEGWLIDNLLAHITLIHTVRENVQEEYINIFPNPAGSIVHIQTQKLLEYHIIEQMQLLDAMGRVAETWANIPTKFWFSTANYSDGLYYLKIKTNLTTETIPIFIHSRE